MTALGVGKAIGITVTAKEHSMSIYIQILTELCWKVKEIGISFCNLRTIVKADHSKIDKTGAIAYFVLRFLQNSCKLCAFCTILNYILVKTYTKQESRRCFTPRPLGNLTIFHYLILSIIFPVSALCTAIFCRVATGNRFYDFFFPKRRRSRSNPGL